MYCIVPKSSDRYRGVVGLGRWSVAEVLLYLTKTKKKCCYFARLNLVRMRVFSDESHGVWVMHRLCARGVENAYLVNIYIYIYIYTHIYHSTPGVLCGRVVRVSDIFGC